MDFPQYVTVEEVKRVCKELNIRDWTKLTKSEVPLEEAQAILTATGVEDMDIPLEDFRQGLEVELEHGMRFEDVNVTNNHPILTGKIVIAHFKESMDYYKRLEVAEIEGDLLKVILSKDLVKCEALFRKLANARLILAQAESDQLAKNA
jgi:hypothetical protein